MIEFAVALLRGITLRQSDKMSAISGDSVLALNSDSKASLTCSNYPC